jgi:alkylation response protein AidB-like acyl-CoA dehydrogenase
MNAGPRAVAPEAADMPEPDDRSDAYQAARDGALSWLGSNWDPESTVRAWWARLAESGWGFPTWPTDWFGRGLSADAAAGVRSAFTETGALLPPSGLGQLLGGPMLLAHASAEQKARYLPAPARGEESWCQFFSEPGSGSDLASAQTRAVPGDGGWIVDGQKVWTSGAQWADRGMLLARTDRNVPKHQGLSFFLIDLDQPAIEVRPLHQMNGEHHFNEVFFTGAQVGSDRLIGEIGGGWSVVVTVLMYERFMLLQPSAMPGRKAGQLAALWASEATHGYLAWGGHGARDSASHSASHSASDGASGGRQPSARGSLTKLARSQLARAGRDTGMSVLGAEGLLTGPGSTGDGQIQHRALTSPVASIAGGTDEIQRGIVGERVLGLPKEPRADRDVPFKDLTIGTQRAEGPPS